MFFDALGIKWEYEPEGYWIGTNIRKRYLPDFKLPECRSWVEVKGDVGKLDFQRLADAVDWGCGLPDMAESLLDNLHGARGFLILGPIPPDWASYSLNHWCPVHPILQHHKGGWLCWAQFKPGGFDVVKSQIEWFDASVGYQTGEWTERLKEHFEGTKGIGSNLPVMDYYAVQNAYNAARQARFEHGEKG